MTYPCGLLQGLVCVDLAGPLVETIFDFDLAVEKLTEYFSPKKKIICFSAGTCNGVMTRRWIDFTHVYANLQRIALQEDISLGHY